MSYRATDAQKAYITRLANEAFGNRYHLPYPISPSILDRMPKEDAARLIGLLLAAKKRGWTPEPEPVDENVFAHIEYPNGKRSTLLVHLWERFSERPQAAGAVLVKVGPLDKSWHREGRR